MGATIAVETVGESMRSTSSTRRPSGAALAVTIAMALSACGFDVTAQGEARAPGTPAPVEEAAADPGTAAPEPDPVETAADPSPEPAETSETSEASEPSEPSEESSGSSGSSDPSEATSDDRSIPLELEQRHPNGTLLRLEGVTIGATSLTVRLSAVNGYRDPVTLAQSPFDGMVVTDDLDTTYNWSQPEENGTLQIEPGGTLDAEVVFLGELDPDATTLTLTSNPDGANFDGDSTIFPSFRFEIPLDAEVPLDAAPGTAAAEDPEPAEAEARVVEVGQEQRHPTGVLMRVERLTIEPTFVSAEISAVNGYRDPINLAQSPFDGMTLVDDLGTVYNWSQPEENGVLRIEPGGTLEGAVVFLGELNPDASSLTLTTNPDSANFDSDSTIFPSIRFEIGLS